MKTMKSLLLAGVTVLSLGVGAAMAQESSSGERASGFGANPTVRAPLTVAQPSRGHDANAIQYGGQDHTSGTDNYLVGGAGG